MVGVQKERTVKELKAEWQNLLARPATNNGHGYLGQRLAYRFHELTWGGLAKPVIRLLDALADEVEGKKVRRSVIADPRNPVIGTRLVREWDATEHVVTVMKDGFDWQGRRYKSLSAGPPALTGPQWTGYRFLGPRERNRARA